MELIKKLLQVQHELKAPKSQFNSFGKYKYRNAEDILEAVKPLCFKNGLLLTISDKIVFVADRHYVEATASVTDGAQTVSTTAYAREQAVKLNKEGKETMDHAQITGSTSSYARKYALNGLFCIDDTKDADFDNPNDMIKTEKSDEVLTHEVKEIFKDTKYSI